MSGCTSTAPAATPTPQIVYITVLVTPTPTATPTPTPTRIVGQDPIIGVWRCSDSSGYDHRYRFNADHTFVESFDFGGTLGTTISKGTWRSQGGNSYVTVDDEFAYPDTIVYSPSRNVIYSKDIPTFVLSPYAGDVKAASKPTK
jgi:hypothetical protein